MRVMLKSKIHRATVTDSKIDYEGSITIDRRLMQAADILPYEQVQVLNINNGARFTTYAIEGREGSGEICPNGAAARLAVKGDLLIILTYHHVTDDEAWEMTRRLACEEGLMVGISAGAAAVGAVRIAQQLGATRDPGANRSVVTIFPDGGERYLSTGVFDTAQP